MSQKTIELDLVGKSNDRNAAHLLRIGSFNTESAQNVNLNQGGLKCNQRLSTLMFHSGQKGTTRFTLKYDFWRGGNVISFETLEALLNLR